MFNKLDKNESLLLEITDREAELNHKFHSGSITLTEYEEKSKKLKEKLIDVDMSRRNDPLVNMINE